MNSHLRPERPVPRLFRAVIVSALIAAPILAQTLPGGMVCGTGPGGGNRASAKIAAQALSLLDLAPADTLAEPVLVDVMFLYTPQAVIGAGDEASIHEKVFESVRSANFLFTNSQVNLRINPVFTGRVEYTESGALDTDVARLANGEGSLSRAATLRNDYKADIVCLIVESENMGAGGYAYDIPGLRGNAAGAFLAIRRVQLGKGSMVLAHELGHLFGCAHDREHAGDLNWYPKGRSYIFGNRLEIEGVTYVDIMSYEPGIYLPYFANPRISLDGVRLGVPDGEARASDLVRTINETVPYVARYREAASRVEFGELESDARFLGNEMLEKSGPAKVKLTRSGDLNTSTRVNVFVNAGSTAKAGIDYIRPATMTVAFATNQSEATLELGIVADEIQEAAESLHLGLTSPLGNHGIGPQGELSLIIHDTVPIVSLTLEAFKEHHGIVEIHVAPVQSMPYPNTVRWRLQSESARSGEDYVEASGELMSWTFGVGPGPGAAFRMIEPVKLTLLDDKRAEPDEVLQLIFEGATSELDGETYVYGSVTNFVRIVDDDRAGAVAPMPGTVAVPEAGMNLAVRHDGKFLVWGGFTPGRSLDRLGIALLGPDGAVDPSFHPPELQAGHRKIEGVSSAQIGTVEFLPNGKFLVAGQFSRVNGQASSQLARLNSDGSLDESFGRKLVFDGTIREVTAQPDGKILVGGSFENINGQRHAFVVRLNADGSLDESFQPNGGPSSAWTVHVVAVSLQHDGKILIGGLFQKVDGVPALNIARLHPDGRLDTTFKLNNVSGPVSRIASQTDGRIILGGRFETVSGRVSRKLARINPDGSVDHTFRPPLPNDEVREVLPLPDGHLLVSGAFTRIGNANRRFIALLNPDGTLNKEFDPGTGPDQFLGPLANATSRAMSIHANGSLYIAGQFQKVNGLASGGIVRLKFGQPGSAITETRPSGSGEITFTAKVFPGGTYPIEATADFIEWSEIGSLRAQGYERQTTTNLPRQGENRFFRLRNPTQ